MAAVLSPTLLFNLAVAQVPTFDFHSVISRMQCDSTSAHGYLSIRDVSQDDKNGQTEGRSARSPTGFDWVLRQHVFHC